MTKINY